MKRTIIYIENSVFGFYYDVKDENKTKMQSTKTLFDQIKSGMFQALTSPLTVKELSAASDSIKDKLLALIKDYDIKIVDIDEDELTGLVKKYMVENIVPDNYINDAIHVAYATILKVDILVSFNLEHIANEWSTRRFNAVNLKEGYFILEIRTPEGVIHYGD